MAKQVASEWRHPVETAKAEIGKAVDTAKQFREQLKKLVDETGANETSTVYRTQGGKVPNASRNRILIDENGNVTINGDNMLYVTIDDISHQIYFYNKRGGVAQDAEIVSFEIPKSLAEEIKQNAVPQDLGKENPGKPQISDETKSTGAYGLPKEYIEKIQGQAIQGSGKISKLK
jgi:filamentous hemagglutinin